MAKTPSIRLFRLINSLSGSEKRYFKLYVNQHGKKDSKYLLLFHEMDKMVEFDEDKLKKVVYKGKAIQSRKYSELKSYLYDLILKSLQSFDEQSAVDSKLKSMLQGIRALFKRSLFEDCHLLILKAEKLAQKYEEFKVVIELQGWKRKVAYTQNDITFLNKELESINEIEDKAISQLQDLLDYNKSFFQLFISTRKNPADKSESERKEDNDFLNSLLSKDVKQVHSHLALIRLYRTRTIYHFSKGNYKNFFEESKILTELMEEKPQFLKEDISEYISVLNNYIISGLLTKKYQVVQNSLDKLKALAPLTLDDKTKLHRQYYTMKFEFCILSGDFDEGLSALNEHLKGVQNLDESFFNRDSFLFQYFYIQFGVENYDTALDYLNRMLSLPKRVERQDLWVTARIVNLILHYEMGNIILLDSLIRSTYRYLSKSKILSIYENTILSFFRDLLKLHDKKQVHDTFTQLKTELSKKKYDNPMYQTFNMVAWVESKIQQRKFQSIIQEDFQNNQNIEI